MEEKQENTEQRPAQRPGKPRATTSTTRTSTPTAKTATARTRTGSGHRGLFPLVEERPGRSAPGWQDRRHTPGRAALAAPASRQQRKLCFWCRRTTHVGPDGSFVSATAAMWRDIPLAPEGLHDSRASGPRSLAGNLDSPQADVFLTSIIDGIVGVATYYMHHHAI